MSQTDHRHCRRMLANKQQDWNHQHCSRVLFAYESIVSLYNCNGRTRVFRRDVERLVDWCIPEIDGIRGNNDQSCRRLILDSSSNIAWDQCWCFQFRGLSANIRRRQRWSGASLGHWPGCLERYPAVTKIPWAVWTMTGQLIRLISSTRSWTLREKNISPNHMENGAIIVSVWSSSIDAPGQDCCSHKHDLGFLYSTLWHSSNSRHLLLRLTKTWEPNYILQWLQARYWLAWSPLWFEKVICAQRWPSTGCDQHKWYFGYLKKSALPRKKAYRDWTRMMVDYKCLLDERLVTQNGGHGGGDLTQLGDSVYVKEPGHSRHRLACSALNHCLNKWNSFLDWILRNKFQQNASTVIFAEENAFESVVNIMATVLSQF